MKTILSLSRKLIFVVLITACSSPTPNAPAATAPATAPAITLTNDFTPPTGREPNARKESPGEFRLLSATSPDALTFTRTNQVIGDQANVPDMIVDEQGQIFLYYTISKVDNIKDACVVAISSDNGKTWVYKLVKFKGIERQALSDPDVVRLPDGTIRLYGTTQIGKNIGIVVGESRDGITFDVRGTAFEVAGENALDSITYQFGGQWHILTLANENIENMFYGTSSDGLKFTYKERVTFKADNRPYAPSNGIAVNNGDRMYAFTIPDIRSFFSTDGKTWKIEDGVRLAFDKTNPLESEFVKDAAVVKLANGSYFMVYATKLK
ncbi:MAG: exo-alpha-sialidase [Chloroflexi bacterium]|nr:exo-alpha-sialidase [Chloroflexota bacterium]